MEKNAVVAEGNGKAVAVIGEVMKNMPMIAICNDASNPRALEEIISENLDGVSMGLFDLDMIKVPSGGNTSFDIPDNDKSKIEGIILDQFDMRSYWSGGDDDESLNSPPDCTSYDLITGYGNPGGMCATCPYSKFGSGKNDGQACKHIQIIFLSRENSFLPVGIKLPPTSLKALKKYSIDMMKKGLKRDEYIAVFTLRKVEKTKTTPAYSVIEIASGEKIPSEFMGAVANAKTQVKAFINAMVKEMIRIKGESMTSDETNECSGDVIDTEASTVGGFDYFNGNGSVDEDEAMKPVEEGNDVNK